MNLEKITTALGLTEKDKIRVDLIISQINAKGVLTVQDFRHQLGEMLPGIFKALSIATKLNIVDANNALKNGELKSELLLDILSEYQKLCGLD